MLTRELVEELVGRYSRAAASRTATSSISPAIRSLVDKLVDPLVRQTEELRSVTRTHLEASAAQHANGATGGGGGTPVFVVGLLSKPRVGANRLLRTRRKLDVVDDLRPLRVVDEQSHRLSNTASRLIHRTALCVTAT
jgi:hypothetical protein